MTATREAHEIETNLRQYTGTEQYYRHAFGLVYTDGARYLAQSCGAYWLLDAIAIYQFDRKVKKSRWLQEHQFWRLRRNETGGATLTCVEDSGRPPVITHEVEYTDFPLDEIEIWVEDKCMLLPSEH